jgi:hypothetical protein
MNHSIFFQRLESAAFLLAIVLQYHHIGASWVLFAILFFAPDLFIVGYLGGNRMGAIFYNIGHSLTLPILISTIGYINNNQLVHIIGLVWLGHIGFDRALGFGLKEKTSFKHTHLGTIGKQKKRA